ncbi:unnamed protein product [Ilex paraguariensis]|uniref:Chlororespiratory reduction 4 n=1 Tax=Ilex paraguariensis TaxID=185542 RepID=A0ABC8SUT7_9AQUA
MPCSLELKISFLLQQCTFKQLRQIHAYIITTSLNQNTRIQLKFLRRTTEFGGMDYSHFVFTQMDSKCNTNITLWNAMIRGYAYNGPSEKCLSMYDEMPHRGLKPNNFTYPYVLNSCSELGWFRIGRKVQCQIVKTGFECVLAVATALFNLYVKMVDSFGVSLAKSGSINDLRKIFNDIYFKPIELWNKMISEYASVSDVVSAVQLFDDMCERDVVSWNSMISGYAWVGDIANARNFFERMPGKDVVSWTTMIGVYASCGDLETARNFFEKMPERNAVSWNSMISSYTQNGNFEEALTLFAQMQLDDVGADGFTFVSALSACSHLGALEFGKWVHSLIKDWPKLAVTVGTAVTEMYAKCGDVTRAFTTFIKIGNKDVFCYNVMIKSLAIHGRTEDAVKIFCLMQKRGLQPNDFTFNSVLFACSHGGLVEEGRKIFYSMERAFGVSPKLEHYGCLIDLLCRNGKLEEADSTVKAMPFEPDVAIWGALLGGCRVRGDLKLAEHITERASELKANESGVYVLLSNMHASVGQWPEALHTRNKMEEKRIYKRTGGTVIL